jgi:hypothetical protein
MSRASEARGGATRGVRQGSARLLGAASLVVILASAAAVALDQWLWNSWRLAAATSAYGTVMTAALLLLHFVARRGPVLHHLLFITPLVALALILPAWLESSSFGTGSRWISWIAPFVFRLAPYVLDPFSGLLMEAYYLSWELLNGLALIATCASAWVVLAFRRRRACKLSPDDPSISGYFWDSLHNTTVAATLRWTAVLTVVMMLVWGALNSSMQPGTAWFEHASGFVWFPMVAAVFHLALLAQRERPIPGLAAATALYGPGHQLESVRPLYEKLVNDFRGEAALAYHSAPPEPEGLETSAGPSGAHSAVSTERLEGVLKVIAGGGKVLRLGVADRDFYRLFSEAVQRQQDEGQATLVICPDRTSNEVKQALSSVTRFLSPEITQRWCELTHREISYTGRALYDLILVEETAFHDVIVESRGEFELSLRRTRLVVLVDFHAIDACRLYLGLARLRNELDLDKQAVLCLSRHRIGLEEQLRLLIPGVEPLRPIERFATTSREQPLKICWSDGFDLPERLAQSGRIIVDRTVHSSTYLVLAGATDGLPASVLVDEAINPPHDFEHFKSALEARGESALARRLERTRRLAHYAPAAPIRVSIVQDGGNLADVVDGGFDFFHAPGDRLVHFVSAPYPVRQFAVDWLRSDPDGFKAHAAPFAQKPGIGLTELAIRIETALREDEGVDERELARLLSQAAGDLPRDLSLGATKSGLVSLFQSIDPSFQSAAIDSHTYPDQTHRFRLQRAYRIGGIAHMAEVVQGSVRIGFLSPRDEGLTYDRDTQIYLSRQFHRISRFEDHYRRIVVAPAERDALTGGRRSRTLFQRTYTLHLDNVAREQEILQRLDHNGQIARMHVHASMSRQSEQRLNWPVDVDLLSTSMSIDPEDASSLQTRPFRGVYLVTVRSTAAQVETLYSPAVRRTLVASLQDTLGFLFPSLAERIVVVEIGGEPLPSCDAPYDRLRFRYSRGEARGGTVEDAARSVFRRAGEPLPQYGEDWAGIDLAVIEDADGDIGVVRRLHDNWRGVLPIWRRYLDWASKQPLWQPDLGLFDAAAARSLRIFG